MPLMYQCPYFQYQTKRGVLHCEAADIKFPDVREKEEFRKCYCSNQPGWQKCPLAMELNRYYERQGNKHEKL